jgi:hypothetical protein
VIGRHARAYAAVGLTCLFVGVITVAASRAGGTVSTTVTVPPVADSYTSQAAKTTNFGSETTMTSGGATRKVKRVYLRFTVADIPAGATVTGARLVMTALNSSGIQPVLKRQTTGSWTESTLTYANAPSLGTTITTPPAVKAGPVTFQVQNVVKGNGTFAFGIQQGSSKETSWSSREGTKPPQLIVTYSQPAPTPTPSDSVSPTPVPDAGNPCGTQPAPPSSYDHIIWILMENKDYSQVIGDRTDAPYINELADACATVQGQQKPDPNEDIDSLPNYIAYTSGDTQGLTANVYPATNPLTADNIFRQVLTPPADPTLPALTAKSYAESMPGNCVPSDDGKATTLYRVKHNPWPYYTGGDDSTACQQFNVPMGPPASGGAFYDDLTSGALPTFSFITPNITDDMHNGSSPTAKVRNGDGWLQQWMPIILGSDAYKAGGTAVFLLWDEPATLGQPVPNLFIAPSIPAGTTVPAPTDGTTYDHYSVLRTTEEMLGLPLLDNAATALSLRTALNI